MEEREARVVAERQEIALRSLEDEERSLAEQDTLPAEGVVASLREAGASAVVDPAEWGGHLNTRGSLFNWMFRYLFTPLLCCVYRSPVCASTASRARPSRIPSR